MEFNRSSFESISQTITLIDVLARDQKIQPEHARAIRDVLVKIQMIVPNQEVNLYGSTVRTLNLNGAEKS